MKTFCNLLLMCFLAFPVSAQRAVDVIPGDGWLDQWEASREIVDYQGDDLFFLINGGADLYMEYGFADVAAVELQHPEKGSLYVEVYRMDSDSAAFGIFSLRRSNNPVAENPGQWLVFGGDSFHKWRGNYYISASGSRLENGYQESVFMSLNGWINENIPAGNTLPMLYHEAFSKGVQDVKYMMGPLALNNVYMFGPYDIFKVKEALMVGNQMIFRYSSARQAGKIFEEVVDYMQQASRFSDFTPSPVGFTVTDRNGRKLSGSVKQEKIFVLLGE